MAKVQIRQLRFDDFAAQRLYNKDECCVRRTMTRTKFTGFVNDTRVDISFAPTDDKVVVQADRNTLSVANIITAKINAAYKGSYNIDVLCIGDYTLYTFSNDGRK